MVFAIILYAWDLSVDNQGEVWFRDLDDCFKYTPSTDSLVTISYIEGHVYKFFAGPNYSNIYATIDGNLHLIKNDTIKLLNFQ